MGLAVFDHRLPSSLRGAAGDAAIQSGASASAAVPITAAPATGATTGSPRFARDDGDHPSLRGGGGDAADPSLRGGRRPTWQSRARCRSSPPRPSINTIAASPSPATQTLTDSPAHHQDTTTRRRPCALRSKFLIKSTSSADWKSASSYQNRSIEAPIVPLGPSRHLSRAMICVSSSPTDGSLCQCAIRSTAYSQRGDVPASSVAHAEQPS